MAHRKRAKQAQREKEEGLRREKSRHQRRLAIGAGIIVVIFVVVFYALAGSVLTAPSGPRTGVRVGDLAADFVLTDVNGGTFRLSDHRGQPVLLDFMGSRCPTCVQQMPFLVSIDNAYTSRGLAMISIDIGGSLGTEDPSVARTFLATYGGTWQIALDNSNLGLTFQVSALPTIYVIDADGRVAFRHGGVITDTDLAVQIERLV